MAYLENASNSFFFCSLCTSAKLFFSNFCTFLFEQKIVLN